MPEMPETMPGRVAELERIAADHEDRIVELEAEVAGLNMLSVGLTERLNVQRMVIASHSDDLARLDETIVTVAARLEGALRVLAGYRGFARSQQGILRMLDEGYATDAITPNVLVEPLL